MAVRNNIGKLYNVISNANHIANQYNNRPIGDPFYDKITNRQYRATWNENPDTTDRFVFGISTWGDPNSKLG